VVVARHPASHRQHKDKNAGEMLEQMWGQVAVSRGSDYYLGMQVNTNNTGELTAIIETLLWFRDYSTAPFITISTDSLLVRNLAYGACSTKTPSTLYGGAQRLRELMTALAKHVAVEQVPAHLKGKDLVFFNARADMLAKLGAGGESYSFVGRYSSFEVPTPGRWVEGVLHCESDEESDNDVQTSQKGGKAKETKMAGKDKSKSKTDGGERGRRTTRSAKRGLEGQTADPAVARPAGGEEYVGRSSDGELELRWSWREAWRTGEVNLVPEGEDAGPLAASEKQSTDQDQLKRETLASEDPVGHLRDVFRRAKSRLASGRERWRTRDMRFAIGCRRA
jgi:ribonuclease HI